MLTSFKMVKLHFIYFFGIFGTSVWGKPLSDCPCQNKAWCDPVDIPDRKEIFIFSTTPDYWKLYDWSKVTTIVQYGSPNTDLLCFAHSKGVRVVRPVDFPTKNLTNANDRAAWVKEQVTYLQDNFLDGMNIDFEDVIMAGSDDQRNGLTALVQESAAAIRQSIKGGGQLSFDVGYTPPNCKTSPVARCYNYTAIAKETDFLFIMAYDENWGNKTAWANSPYTKTTDGVKQYMSIGIPASKLILGIPWYGYDYPCKMISQDNKCTLVVNNPGGTEVNYALIKGKYMSMATTPRLWDPSSKSPFYNYKNPNETQIHQMWYDDPESLGYKYAFAQQMALRGVGMWTANALNYTMTPEGEAERREMWGALPKYH